MRTFRINLPYTDEHFQCEDFVNAILKLSNGTDEDGRPYFETSNLYDAMKVVTKAYELCKQYLGTIELRVTIRPNDVLEKDVNTHA